jgi:hypothetical protein
VAPDLLDLFVCARQANGSVSEPAPERGDGDEKAVGGEQRRAPRCDARPASGFERSQALFARLVEWAAGEQALGLEHSELEARLAADGRELARQVLQDQFDLRAVREQPPDAAVIGSDGMPRRSVERGHERDLHTVLGEVQVARLAYRAVGSENLYPADAQLKATRLALEPNKRQGADRCADYLLAKRPYLDYPTALKNGWPIATGVSGRRSITAVAVMVNGLRA